MKQIDKAKNYYITEDGEVFSKTGHKKSIRANRDGYMYAEFYENNKSTAYTIHRIVALAFIPNPENKPCVNHIDGDKSNNRVSNLEWVTYSENNYHAFATGLSKPRFGSDAANAVLDEDTVHVICRMMQEGYRNLEIVKELGVESYLVKNIRAKNSWSQISDQYKIPEKSRAVSDDTAHWVCRMIEKGYRNRDIVEMSTNPRVKKHIVSQIKNGIMLPEISKDYNLK